MSRSFARLPHDDGDRPSERAQHEGGSQELSDSRQLMIAVQRACQLEDALPVVAFDLRSGLTTQQDELQRAGVVDIHGDVRQVLAGPPGHDRRTEGIRARRQERDHADHRDEDLRQTAPERHQEIAKRREGDVTSLMKRDADEVQK